MSRYENSLTTLQARTIAKAVSNYPFSLSDRKEIETAGKNIVKELENLFPAQFPFDDEHGKENNPHFSYIAFAFATCAKEGIKRGQLTVLEYISILASVKEDNEMTLKDFGAFGDLYEILIRCAMMKKYTLVRWSMLSVKAVETSDIISKKFGVVEVGHNGKSLSFGTLFDYMEGEYTSIVYGVFSEEDKKEVYKLCKNQEYEKALDYVTSYSVFWENKYDFQNDMDNLTRGKGIAAKGANIQVVYNPSKYNAFVAALEDGKFISFFETLKR